MTVAHGICSLENPPAKDPSFFGDTTGGNRKKRLQKSTRAIKYITTTINFRPSRGSARTIKCAPHLKLPADAEFTNLWGQKNPVAKNSQRGNFTGARLMRRDFPRVVF